MASMTIRNLDEPLKVRLRIQAARHGRSMEEEARDILRSALASEPPQGDTLVSAIRGRLAPFGGVDLVLPARDPIREPSGFGA